MGAQSMKTYDAEYWGLKIDTETHELTKQKRKMTVRADSLTKAMRNLTGILGDMSRVKEVKE